MQKYRLALWRVLDITRKVSYFFLFTFIICKQPTKKCVLRKFFCRILKKIFHKKPLVLFNIISYY